MRSRYSAYVLGDEAYLLRTWHASTRPTSPVLAGEPVKWLGLRVVRTDGRRAATMATVWSSSWRATSPPARPERLHEVSRFVKEHGQWFYVDGVASAD
ncbi:MAG: zinc chelation protein SecC [Comamonadaceae bacterium]|nr:zinc chelation protein SecC [Comamonadaceae bacterium]